MKKLILSSVAFAAMTATAVSADLRAPAPVYKAPPPVVAPMSDWTGVYIGISGGYAFGRSEFDPTGSLTGEPRQTVNHDGGLFGGQIGFNYQLPSRLVIGAVADGSWAGLKGNVCVESGGCDGSADDSYAHAKINWLATFRGNLGFTPSNDVLAYVTGGLAVAGIEGRITQIFSGAPDLTDKATRTGWTVGGGLKYRMARSWSVGAEYLYVDLGKHGYTFTNASIPIVASDGITADVKTHLNVIRASLSYEFGSANSISTRY